MSGSANPDGDDDGRQIRQQLVAILDRLNSLASDDVGERLRLARRQDELRHLLRSIEVPGADAIVAGWAVRAHYDEDEPVPIIPSPIEPGGSAAV